MLRARFVLWSLTISLFAGPGGERAASAADPLLGSIQPITCEGSYPGHLQGICTNYRDTVYWSFTTVLVKTDAEGRLSRRVDVANHHGDLCFHDGRVYVAVNLGKFNQPPGQEDSWVYVYDEDSLEEIARYPTPELVHGAGGMAWRDGRFVIVGGLPKDIDENYVYEYDESFEFIKRHVLPSGHTDKGIQTAEFYANHWWFGCYGKPRILLVADPSFGLVGRFEFDCALGITGLPDGRSLVGSNRRTEDGYVGRAQIAVPDEWRGLRYVADVPSADRTDGGRPTRLDFWFAPSTQKVFPDSRSTDVERGKLSAARNEYESVQLVLRPEFDISGVRVKLESGSQGDSLPADWVNLFEVRYVRTPGIARWGFPPDYPDSRRSVYPDPLVPLMLDGRGRELELAGDQAQSIWIRVNVSPDARPGKYDARIVVTAESLKPVQAPLTLEVQPFVLPQSTGVRTAVGLTRRDLARFHHVAADSEACKHLYRRYYDDLLDYRLCAYELPFKVDEPAARPYLHDERVNSFHAPYSKAVWNDLQRQGMGDKAWLYLVDEPETKAQYDALKKHGEYVRRDMPGLRHGVPFFVGPQWDKSLTPFDVLGGYVDLWVCQTDYYHDGHGQGAKVRRQMRERFQDGEETWWYVAAGPREPYCNFFVNMTALQHRILFWQIYADPIISGLMYWRSTHWWEVEDPFVDVATVKGIDAHLYGDGMLFYPGHPFGIAGPVGSVRLECIRDGLEDHAYLSLAERRVGREAVMLLVDEVTRSLVDYTREPTVFQSVREQVTDVLTRSAPSTD